MSLARLAVPAIPVSVAPRGFTGYEFRYLALPAAILLVAFATLRMVYAGSVEPDEADLILFGQQLAWGYSEQPPLYSWLCAAAFELLGTGTTALVVVHTAILAAIVVTLHALARTALHDRRRALFATFGALLVPALAWQSLTYLTHSVLAFLAGIACLDTGLRIVRDGRTRDYVVLGIVCAAGVLSKYNFAWFALAFLLAGLSVAPARRRLLDRRMILTLIAFALPLAPHALWMFDHRSIIRDELINKVTHARHADHSRLARSLFGLRELIQNVLIAAVPIALAVHGIFRHARRDSAGTDFASLVRVLFGRFLAVSLVLMVAMILANGWDRFHERWLMPFALVMPIWLFARLDAEAISPSAARRFGLLLLGLAVAYTAVRTVQVSVFLNDSNGFNPTRNGMYPLRLDFSDLAKAIEAEAGPNPLILTRQREVGGNLRLAMPGARVLCATASLYDLPPAGRPIVIAWNPVMTDDRPDVPWSWLMKYWAFAPPRHVPPERVRVVRIAATGYNGRPASVAFAVLD